MKFRAKNRREIFSYTVGVLGFINFLITFFLLGICYFYFVRFDNKQLDTDWIASCALLFIVISAIASAASFLIAYKIAKKTEPKDEGIFLHLTSLKYRILNILKNTGHSYAVAIFMALYYMIFHL